MDKSFFFSLGAWNWFILAAILGVFEVMMPGFLLIWYASAAVLVGALALGIDLAWQWQLALYALIGMGLLFLSSKLAKNQTQSDKPLLNQRAAAHVGKVYPLATAANHGHGKLKVGDSLWSVQLEDDAPLPEGTGIVITGVDGNKLIGKQK